MEQIIKPVKLFLYSVIILFALTFSLLYSATGNTLLLPYVSHYFTKHLNDRIKVEVTDMALSLPNFKALLLLDDMTIIETEGIINPFSKSFKIDYKLITPNIICQKRALYRDFYLNGEANGTINRLNFNGNGKIFSSKNHKTLATVTFKNGNLDKALKTVKCDYQFIADNLSLLTKEKYHGSLNVLGNILYHHGVQINGGTEDLGGYAHFHYQDDKVNLELSRLDAQKMLYLLDYPAVLDAKVNGTIDYHLNNETANIDLGMKNINFLNCITTQNLYNVLKVDMRKSSFKYGQFTAHGNNAHLNCDFKIQNKNSHLYITATEINQNRQTINALFDMKMQNQALSGKLYGNLYEPNIKINMGDLFAFKVKQMIRPATSFDMKSKFDCIKGVADGLFGGFF